MKLLLYCTKSKPYLYRQDDDCFEVLNKIKYEDISDYEKYYGLNNGKVIGECDFEIEKFSSSWYPVKDIDFRKEDIINDLKDNCPKEELEEELEQANLYFNLLENSCLTRKELRDYVRGTDWFYAIHLKNLHIFDTPKELSDYIKAIYRYTPITKAPQNMMYCKGVIKTDVKLGKKVFKNAAYQIKHYVLASVQPYWLCKILNGEKTIEIRKVVPKGMLYDIKIN